MGPRDAVQGGVPTNYETGEPLTPGQIARLERLKTAGEGFRDQMHDAEGSSTGDGWDFNGQRMRQAAVFMEMALMLARRAALEVK